MTAWRYQPVWKDFGEQRVYSLCEVYIDADGKLESWTDDPAMIPQGEEPDELRMDLTHMLMDSMRWVPVAVDTLTVGMTFQRAITREQCNEIADALDAFNEMARTAMKAVN